MSIIWFRWMVRSKAQDKSLLIFGGGSRWGGQGDEGLAAENLAFVVAHGEFERAIIDLGNDAHRHCRP